jgi:hypothetical protein
MGDSVFGGARILSTQRLIGLVRGGTDEVLKNAVAQRVLGLPRPT